MDTALIIVSGLPASGKTTFAARLSEELSVPMASKDIIKEHLYDTVGFRSRAEKVALTAAATSLLYYFGERHLAVGRSVILENNYDDKAKPGLLRLIERYPCRTLTVHFTGDYRALYTRFIERDRSPSRHRGHVVNSSYPETGGDTFSLESRGATAGGFERAMRESGVAGFTVGGCRIEVDTTDFSKTDFAAVIWDVKRKLSEKL